MQLNQLSDDARQLLSNAKQGGVLVVEDENGQARSRVYVYKEPSEEERQAAWGRLRGFQKKVGQSFDEQGVSEDDLDQLLQEDD